MQNSEASLRSENLLLRGKITELEAEIEVREEQRRDVAKQLVELGKSNQEMTLKVEQYRKDNELQVSKLHSQLEEKSTALAVSRSQLQALQQSNQALGQLLQSANGRIVQLTRQLAQRNRFIKEYFEQQQISDM